ncbi:MAG: hypothetical protein F2901_06755, partial [Actinobacteria bacterium]|nr:hypothetical protein [Actinomycetota bacterium]
VPRSVVADANNTGGIRVTWVAPLSNGGIDITGYEIQACIDDKCSDAATSNGEELAVVVEELTLGKAYTFIVAAKNTIGLGEYSTPSNEATPRTPPPAPTAVTAAVNNVGGVDVSWTAPEQNNGAAITGYTVSACEYTEPVLVEAESNQTPDTAGQICSDVGETDSSNTALAVGDLRAGQAYTFTVAAINIAGIGTYSDPSDAVTPRVVPNAPTNVVGEVGNRGAVSVSWDAPNFNGGAEITDYVVKVCTDAGCVAYSDDQSDLATAAVANLTVGNSYTFIVAAVNAAGTGAYSDPSAAVTPRTLPQPPTGVNALPNNLGGIVATWIAPTNNGGAAVSGYDVRACLAEDQKCSDPVRMTDLKALSITLVEEFTLGSSYYVEVSAVNVAGSSEYSEPSNEVVPRKVPDAPTAVKAVVNNTGGVSLSWTAAKNNGAVVTDYFVKACAGGKCDLVEDGQSDATSTTLSGLTVGTSYTFVVAAVNGAGPGKYSDPSDAVTPRMLPSAPTQVSAIADKLGNIDVKWSAPNANGAAITDYVIQSCAAKVCTTFDDGTSTTTSVQVSKLPLGVAVTFQVAAVNAAGTGEYSSPSNEVVPASPPGAPTGLDGTPDNTFVNLTWTAPVVTGGFAISDYVVQVCTGGSCVVANDGNSPNTTAKIIGLKNGTAYTFTVAAVNSIGTGAASEASRAITPRTVPGAPTNLLATADFNRQTFVEWKNPVDNGGAAINGYRVQWCLTGYNCYTSRWNDASTKEVSATKAQILYLEKSDFSFSYRVSVSNEAGWGPWAQRSNDVVARSAPNTPSNVVATANNTGGIVLTWTAPFANNAAITDYVVKACADKECVVLNDGVDVFATKTITGLTLGKEYTFTVAAVNLAGTSADSSPSNGATPRTVPDAPTDVVATIDDEGQVALTWVAPVNNGGNAISDYAVQSCIGTKCTTFKDEVSTELKATVTGLINGTAYTFKVAATNAAGTGAYSSASSSVTPRTVAGVPTGVVGTPGNTEVKLVWVAPSNNGGSEITDYVVQSCEGTTCSVFEDSVSAVAATTVTGLKNGTAYTFRVAAVNAAKSGGYSEKSEPVTPRTVPGAPTAVLGAPNDIGQIAVSWKAPTDNGGNAISNYVVQKCLNASCQSVTRTANPPTSTTELISSVESGIGYTFRVAALNAAGQGAWSSESDISIPRMVPGRPTAVAGTPGDKKVDLTWTAPRANGSDITTYVVSSCVNSTCTPFVHDASTATQLTVTGLTNGTAYTFTVAATNGIGTGEASAPSAAITPRTVPGAPTGVMASIDNDGKVVITWKAPTDNGGNAIKDYIVKSCVGTTCAIAADSTSNTLSATISGLALRTSYTFIVAAKNDAGVGPYSSNSEVAILRKLPSVPNKPTAVPNNTGGVVVTWVAPDDGGADISDYVVQSCTASNVCTDFAHTASSSETITVTGLATGSPFTFKVAAKNAAGTGGFSLNSDAAIPRVVPDAPTSISAAANGSGEVVVKWIAPAKNGGNAISDYDVQSCISTTCTSFAHSPASTATTQTLTGLQTGTAYTFKVAAINAAGKGAYSTPTQSEVTPFVKPDAPTEVVATANNTGGIAVTWKAPVNTGGIAISDYDVQSCISTTCTSFARASASALLTQTVTGLTKGTAYTFKVAAINTAGTGLYSLPSDPATPRVVPGAVSKIAGTPGDDKVDLSWTAPTDNGGSSITSYSVAFSSDAGSSWSQDQSANTTSLSVTGLSGGTDYLFRVAANNAAGRGPDATSSAIRTNPFACVPTKTTSGLNVVLTFSKIGTCVWTVPNDVSSLDTLIIGGGGGASAGNSGAGGGAASVVSGIAVVPGASLYITVGQGGVAGASSPAVSATPGFSSGIAIGAKSYVSNGGAASTSTSAGAGGTSTSGFAGGIGGTSALGKSGTNSYITGTATVYGSGGAGTASASGTAGAANTGNGGGSGTGAGGAGGSGVALLRFAAAPVNAFPSFIGQPFARYVASDYQTTDSTRKTWVDSSGNNRPAISVGGTPGVS